MFQCVEHQIERLDRLLSLGCVHPFEKAVDDGVVLEGGFRAPLAHRMKIAPLGTAVARFALASSSISTHWSMPASPPGSARSSGPTGNGYRSSSPRSASTLGIRVCLAT